MVPSGGVDRLAYKAARAPRDARPPLCLIGMGRDIAPAARAPCDLRPLQSNFHGVGPSTFDANVVLGIAWGPNSLV
ncbi:hypothetical protein NDU88_005709 [Pleurodeles waltl]|uniref:Uncharacterized protein n=1 Tax=Pleurodeles waltl TaxID=8319 RepID=A0AAV7VJR5_PLEWA|nr:hypothetical protein NDU88_005709 [Pleurodeles waltl]